MYQRLLLLLAVLFMSGALMAQNVMRSNDSDYIYNIGALLGSSTNPKPLGINGLDTMQKWVHDPTQKNRITFFDQSHFKSYRYGTTSFRLRYPNNYDSTKKYPCVVFLHGAGEACQTGNSHNVANVVDRENQDQLFWGADTFEVRINKGEYNGFLLFPQIYDNSAQWGTSNGSLTDVTHILDTLTKYNGLDPDRIVAMGLSAGGVGAIKFAHFYPQYIAGVVASSPELISDETHPDPLNGGINPLDYWVQIPIFMTAGGLDAAGDSDPPTMFKARDSITAHFINIFFGFYGNEGHDTWEKQWVVRDAYNNHILTNYWLQSHKAQPLVYGQNTKFCAGQPISLKLGLTPGYFAYEWQMNNGGGFTTVGTANTYIATQAGTYQVHFKRTSTSNWSDWTPNPVVITTTKCSADTAFAEHFDETPVVYVAATPAFQGTPYVYQNFICGNGLFPNHTEDFSTDGTGRMGGRFMLNNTLSGSQCTYVNTDQVYRTFNPPTVLPNTNYALSFSVANLVNYYANAPTAPPASLSASITSSNGSVINLTPAGGVRAMNTGNLSWKKYTYIWNSGNSNSAQIAITNNTTTTTWNDFALDEILLVKYKAPAMPGAAFANVALWSKGNSINAPDNSVVDAWNNDDVNGFSLKQATPDRQPIYKNNSADNINFNPVINFIAANNKNFSIDTGFSSNTVHNAVHAYMVAKFTNATTSRNVLFENGSAGSVKVAIANPGVISWTAGTTTLSTNSNAFDVTKPSLWTFSKDNINNTGDGNKQDIRKDGVLLKSTSTTSTFTGNNTSFTAGTLDGSVAEIVYVIDSSITALTENRIESYLALKYGTTLGNNSAPDNYTASDSTTIFWNKDVKYQNDVFGIGTDSASGLVQIQSNSVNSGSGDGTGQSAKGNLVVSTSNELLDKRFLMIGNDAGSLTQHIIASGEANIIAVGSTRIIRNWKVANTGSVGPVSLSFDTTGLGNQAGGAVVNKYTLMISNSGDDTYTAPSTFFTATGAAGNKIFFSGVTLNNGAVFTIITNIFNVALPAVWLSFTAEAVNGNGVLNWKTGDEMNVATYTVEHSFNGVSFSPIASLAAYNSSGTNNYNYTDLNLAPGNHYYRIRRTDKDGVTGYSDIKTIRITTNGANVQVRPNPVVGSTLILAVSTQQNSRSNVQVMAVDGKVIVHQAVNLASGNNLLYVNISTVPPGIYLVQVQLNDEVVTKKFVKER